MRNLKNFVKRNAPIFIFGFIILGLFILIIVFSPQKEEKFPSGFKKVEEEIFEREPAEPEPTEKPVEYAPQIPSPENKGKRYFYGEYDPTLRDEQGYPIPPEVGSASLPAQASPETRDVLKNLERQSYEARITPTNISFTLDGFMPADARAFTGQKVIWTNNSGADIQVQQMLPIHEALKAGVVIKPGETFEFKPLIDGQFTYVEKNSLKYGTIFVEDVTKPLMKFE